MRIARVTVDLMRPVPVAPLTIETEILREGRRIQLCAVRLRADGVIVVGATVLKIKVQANELPAEAAIVRVELPLPRCWISGTGRFSTPTFARQPVGEWILLDAESWIGPNGAGLAMARLADISGYFGRAIQSLAIERCG